MSEKKPKKRDPQKDASRSENEQCASKLPPLPRFIEYETLHDRLYVIRDLVYMHMDRDTLLPDFAHQKKFELDTALKQSTAEVLLAAILWIEADRSANEILSHAVPEIKKSLVVTVNRLIRFLELKQHCQPTAWLNRCSLADAWIRLFVEYREAISDPKLLWIWKLQELPYVSELYNPYEYPWESWKEK